MAGFTQDEPAEQVEAEVTEIRHGETVTPPAGAVTFTAEQVFALINVAVHVAGKSKP